VEQQIPTALQAALYAGSVAIIALVSILTVLLLQFRRQIERVVRAVEELKAEVDPLVQDMRVVVERLRNLSESVQGEWMEIKGILDTGRTWLQRANHLLGGIGSVVPPIFAASRGIHILRKGLERFERAFLNREPQHQQKARKS
jgi:uncharacterized protein YoxC